ncbi:MAG: AAA family ATPase [Anaerolineae bacterium]|nr:AAA family ATPase [Anaerolineae bacterium]
MNKKAPDSQAITHLRVSLFGALTIEMEGKPLSPSIQPGVRVLLAYLLLYPQQKHARLLLAGLMWPDMAETRGRHALRDAVWHINKDLPGLLQTDTGAIGISPHVRLWSDVAEFDRLLTPLTVDERTVRHSQNRNDLYQAVRLYRGDLLEGLYEDWILAERDRLSALYLRALEQVVRLEKLAGCYDQALAVAQTLAGADPLQESVHREIMKLNYLLGQPAAALKQYLTCRQIMADEVDTLPDPETTRLAQEIAAGSGQDVPVCPSNPVQPILLLESSSLAQLPLIGRRRERAELTARVTSGHKGVLGLILVEGEAGVGKTRLLKEVARDAQWRGTEVLWGKGKELEAGRPYGPLLEVLNAGLSPLRAGQIAGLLKEELPGLEESGDISGMTANPEQQTVWLQVLYSLIPALANVLPDAQNTPRPAALSPNQEHLRLVEALSHLLIAWSRITPLILILEDLHWADRDTLDTLVHLIEQLPTWSEYTAAARSDHPGADSLPGRVLIIGSYRGEEARSQPEVWERLQRLVHIDLHNRLVLSRLDATATSELVRHSLGADRPAPLFEARLHKATDGNPLFVLETLRYLYEEKLLWRDETSGHWSTPFDETTTDYAELPLSPVIERIIAHRLARLSPEHRLVLNAAAVLGNRFEFSLLATVTDLDVTVLLDIVGTLLQQGFVEEHVQDYRFHHDKIRQVVYHTLDHEERIRLHCRISQILENAQPDRIEMLAHHCTSGQLWDKAISYHELAAEAARSAHTYATALEHLNKAIELLEHSGTEEEQYRLLAAREAVLDVMGEREAQAADLEAMLELAHDDPLRQAHILCRRAELLTNLGRYDKAEAAARRALVIAERSGCESSQVAALIALDLIFFAEGQPGLSVSCLRQAARIGWEKVDPSRQARAHHTMARALLEIRLSEAQTEAQTAMALYERLQDKCGQVNVLISLCSIIHKHTGDGKAVSYCSRALQISRRIGYRLGEAAALANLGDIFYFENRFVQALEACNEAQLIFRILGHLHYEHSMRALIATIHYAILGDLETAWDDLQASVALCKQQDIPHGDTLIALGDIARRRGDYKTARAYLEQCLNSSLHKKESWLAVEAYIAVAQLEIDENHPVAALEHLEAAGTLCREVGISSWDVRLLELRGLVMLALGRPQAALEATSQAMKQVKPAVERAYLVSFRHFQALSALGRTTEACAALEQAYRTLSECLSGFTPDQQKMSWERVPEHRAILAAWKEFRPLPITVRLPRIDAPTGRPLRDDEWVEVQWSVVEPEDDAIPNKAARRRHRMLRLLRQAEEQQASPTVDDLAAALEAGKATLKRDLAALRQAGHTISTRGSREG